MPTATLGTAELGDKVGKTEVTACVLISPHGEESGRETNTTEYKKEENYSVSSIQYMHILHLSEVQFVADIGRYGI